MNNKKTPEEIENMSLREFILFVDFMGTAEFCDWQKIPHPYFTGDIETSAQLFLKVDVIKHKLFIERAKKDRGDGEWVRKTHSDAVISDLEKEIGELTEGLWAVKRERDLLKEDLEIADKAHEIELTEAKLRADKISNALQELWSQIKKSGGDIDISRITVGKVKESIESYKQNPK